ncbi:MAG: FIG00388958: hypothetical protein [uncultured Sulfurovum sp.]|uniref:Protein kinase domain-containing protein n=1 Tax=uncultured Sulfurovum sp. TaxID=269237 RepID=A0A6S6T9L0_9BACT|nr:MAG: FIG00388958: hypothetical protein [uncultured Sulfurovum sp.]
MSHTLKLMDKKMNTQSKNKSYFSLINNIQEYFNNASNSIHKARNEIKIIKYNNQEFIIKSFKIPHIINKIVYSFFRDSKAKKSYENSVKISNFVPTPIGYIEFKKFGLIHDSYFVSEYFNYDFTIREPLLDENFKNKEKILKLFANFSYQLHQKNIYHLDYSPGNILIKKEENAYIFKIVDINRMQFKTLSMDDRLENFSKLWAKDEDMRIIVKEYAKIINEEEKYCIEKAIYFSQKNKNFKNFKKRLKGKKIND